jgi:NAD dependent epimerase/dehydratase family
MPLSCAATLRARRQRAGRQDGQLPPPARRPRPRRPPHSAAPPRSEVGALTESRPPPSPRPKPPRTLSLFPTNRDSSRLGTAVVAGMKGDCSTRDLPFGLFRPLNRRYSKFSSCATGRSAVGANADPLRRLEQGVQMKVLVTGATGFLGHALTLDLLAAGHEASALSRSANAGDAGAASQHRGERRLGTAREPRFIQVTRTRGPSPFQQKTTPDNDGEVGTPPLRQWAGCGGVVSWSSPRVGCLGTGAVPATTSSALRRRGRRSPRPRAARAAARGGSAEGASAGRSTDSRRGQGHVLSLAQGHVANSLERSAGVCCDGRPLLGDLAAKPDP